MTWGHPEGYIEAFANIYCDIAKTIEDEDTVDGLPDGDIGAQGVLFAEAVLKSSKEGAWVKEEFND